MNEFLQRLRERKLVQWTLAYVAAAFALVQGLDLVAQRFGWPEFVGRAAIIVACVGAVVTMLLAWYHGERGAQRVSGTELLLIALVLAVGGGMLWRFGAPAPTPGAPAVTTAPAPTTVDLKAIAVLPFADLSQEQDQAYFSDGLSEELLDRLAKVPQLKVAGRTSSYAFKGKVGDLKAIGAELGVAHVLEGSVRKAGDRVRISAKLVSVADGFEHWSETYDRRLTDVFAVQDEIAVAVVRELRIKLLPNQRVAADRHVPTPEAYDQFLLGQNAMRIKSPDAFLKAVGHFQRAVELDPTYDRALSRLALAESFSAEVPRADVRDPAAVRGHASAMVEKALELNPESAEAYSTRGMLRYSNDWDWSGAQADFDKAFALDPDEPTVLLKYSSLLATLGKVPEAIAALRKESERDPLFPPPWDGLARMYVASGDYPAARAPIARALAVSPENPYPVRLRAVLSLLEGDAAKALEDYRSLSSERHRLGGIALCEFALGHEREAKAALAALEAKHAQTSAYFIAVVHARRGALDDAFRWLDRSFEQREAALLSLQVDPLLAGLRGDPRYQALLARMRLPG